MGGHFNTQAFPLYQVHMYNGTSMDISGCPKEEGSSAQVANVNDLELKKGEQLQ